jgi:hypothetical protein
MTPLHTINHGDAMHNQSQEKKPYAPPTVTEHGNAVKKTLGIGGKYWETLVYQFVSPVEEEVD